MNTFCVSLASAALILSGPTAAAADAELVDAVLTTSAVSCDHIGIEKEQLMDVVKALKAEIVSQLQGGKQVQLDGFGTFYLERVEAPMKTGTKTKVRVREVVQFKAHNAVWMHGEQARVAHVPTNR